MKLGGIVGVGPRGIVDGATDRLETRQWGPHVDWRTGTARIHVRYEARFYVRGMQPPPSANPFVCQLFPFMEPLVDSHELKTIEIGKIQE